MHEDQGRYPHVVRLIRSRILRGVYPGQLPGEGPLAKELHVSSATLRTALAYLEGQGFIRRKRRRGTFSVPLGDSSGTPDRAVVHVFLLTYARTTWAAPILDALRGAAESHGMVTLVTDIGSPNEEGDADQDVDARKDWHAKVLNHAAKLRSAGSVLLTVPVGTGEALELADARSPVVVLDWELPEPVLSSVVSDNKGGGALAAQHLLQLGHRRIGWLQPETHLRRFNHLLRLAGVKETLAQSGLELACEISCDTGEALPGRLKSFLAGPHPFTALICDSAALLSAVVSLIRGADRRIPEEVSVVGIGPSRSTADPACPTMVSLGYRMMGQRAVELLLDEEAIARPRREVIPCRLELGGTTAPPPGA